jgi:hypothetical protein
MSAILSNDPDEHMLIYSFYSDHKKISEPDMEYHHGMGKLTYDKDQGSLSGTYFTSPERGFYGEIKLKKINSDLNYLVHDSKIMDQNKN